MDRIFLPQHLRLRLGDCAVVRAHELVRFQEHGFPLGGRRWRVVAGAASSGDGTLVVAGVEAVLVDVGFDDGVGLDIDHVAAPVRFDP